MKLALVFLLVASTASAQSLTLPRVVLVGGQSFDTAATLLKFSQGCGERNTLAYGSQPSATRLVVTKGIGRRDSLGGDERVAQKGMGDRREGGGVSRRRVRCGGGNLESHGALSVNHR
jgi:hypothetical protein